MNNWIVRVVVEVHVRAEDVDGAVKAAIEEVKYGSVEGELVYHVDSWKTTDD